MESIVSPEVLHQILLSPRIQDVPIERISTTPATHFQTYQQRLLEVGESRENSDPSFALKRAFHDGLVESATQSSSLTPIQAVLVELHQKLRDLVPNRADLHSKLTDVHTPLHLSETLPFLRYIVEAGQALSMLESEIESETTLSWIQTARRALELSSTGLGISFLISSLLYLLDKADRAQQAKDAFYVRTVVVPRLYQAEYGYELERRYFHQRFPNSNLPITRTWIRSLLRSQSESDQEDRLRVSPQTQRVLIARGWIDTILFQKERPVRLPEIFYLDATTIQAIRDVTRLAAAGCALGLVAVGTAQRTPEILSSPEVTRSLRLSLKRKITVTQETYERDVEDAMIGLIQCWKGNDTVSSLTDMDKETIRGQTQNVLRGNDPVIQLMDKRMQSVFSDLAVSYILGTYDSFTFPVPMHSGLQLATTLPKMECLSTFVKYATHVFQSKGLALFALDLATAAELAARVPVLACDLYGKLLVAIWQMESADPAVD